MSNSENNPTAPGSGADERVRHQASQTLRWASEEIRRLRRENEILGAQMRVVSIFEGALNLSRSYGGSSPMMEDVAHLADKLAEEILPRPVEQGEVAP